MVVTSYGVKLLQWYDMVDENLDDLLWCVNFYENIFGKGWSKALILSAMAHTRHYYATTERWFPKKKSYIWNQRKLKKVNRFEKVKRI